jgi:hypothetical protein
MSDMPSPNVVMAKADPIMNNGNFSVPVIKLNNRSIAVVKKSCIMLISFPAFTSDSLAKELKKADPEGRVKRRIPAKRKIIANG